MSTTRPRRRRRFRVARWLVVLALLAVAVCNVPVWILSAGRIYPLDRIDEAPEHHTLLVLGCSPRLSDGRENHFFRNRMDAAAKVFLAGKVQAVLVSGDNRHANYDEPTAMKKALVARGVPEERIVCDYAGFRTLDSVLRAEKVFGQSSFLVLSQPFHARRAVFLARAHGIDASAIAAPDVSRRFSLKTRIREQFARAAAVLDVLFRRKPKFYGPPVEVP